MSAWNEKFDNLNIRHLRSPMFFHPDPRDRDGLLAFAYVNGRESELKEIQGVVGKELGKHNRKKKQKDGYIHMLKSKLFRNGDILIIHQEKITGHNIHR